MKERRERNFRILEFRENKFDIIGDVHGCYEELMELVKKLGYEKGDGCYVHPEGRKLISVGDVAEYDGEPFVVYGHTVVEKPEIINNTVDIDQGCVYGGYLTALRYPEMEFVQVRGKKYAEYNGGGKVPE